MKCKILSSTKFAYLQKDLNAELQILGDSAIDVRFTMDDKYVAALVLYKPINPCNNYIHVAKRERIEE